MSQVSCHGYRLGMAVRPLCVCCSCHLQVMNTWHINPFCAIKTPQYYNNNCKTSSALLSSKKIELSGAPSTGVGIFIVQVQFSVYQGWVYDSRKPVYDMTVS